MCVGFLYTLVVRRPSGSLKTAVSRKASLLSLSVSMVKRMEGCWLFIALGLPEYTVAVDGDLQTCLDTSFTLDTFLRIDLVFVRPIALVHLVSRLDMTDVAVIVGEQCTIP